VGLSPAPPKRTQAPYAHGVRSTLDEKSRAEPLRAKRLRRYRYARGMRRVATANRRAELVAEQFARQRTREAVLGNADLPNFRAAALRD